MLHRGFRSSRQECAPIRVPRRHRRAPRADHSYDIACPFASSINPPYGWPEPHDPAQREAEAVGETLINTLHGPDGGVVVEVRGEVDLASAERLRRLLQDIAGRLRPIAI